MSQSTSNKFEMAVGTSNMLESSMMEGDGFYNPIEGGAEPEQGSNTAWSGVKNDTGQLCRICANSSDYLIPIYEGEGIEHQLELKIQKHLPIQVSSSDTLPIQLCYQCASTLIAWDTMINNCIEAEKKLRSMQDAAEGHDDEDFESKPAEVLEDDHHSDPIDSDDEPLITSKTKVEKSKAAPLKKKILSKAKAASSRADKTTAKSKDKDSEDKERLELQDNIVPNNMTLSEEFNREKSLPHETNTDNCVDTKEANSNIENLSYGETQVNLLKANFFRKRAIHTPFKKRVQCYHCLTMFSTKGSLRRHLQRLSHKKPSLPVTDVSNLSWKEIKDRIYKDKRKLDDEGKEFVNEEIEDTSIEPLSKEGIQEAECVQKASKNMKPLYENSRRNKAKKVQEYSCLECGKRFPYRSSLRVHLTIHQDLPRNHNCDLCESSFKTSSALGRHQLTHAEYYEKKFICEQCGKRFTMSTKLKNHMLTHSDLRPYICRICGTSFKRLTHLRSHEQGVHGVTESSLPKNFVCNICGKAMVKQETLSTHMKEHMGELNFKCKKCHKKFVSNTGLNIHLSMGRCENFIMYCAVCQIEFKSDEQVCEHLNVGDEKRKQPKTKDQGTEEKSSNKQRAKKLKLPRHLREKNFVCSVCNKSYIYSCELKTHFRLAHTNEKPFICELCSKAFKTKASLQIHEDVHADLRPYPCYMCQKRFRKSEHLKLHIRTHTGEKPYICQICERGFSQKGDMKKHMLKTHNRPFVNSSTSVTFTS